MRSMKKIMSLLLTLMLAATALCVPMTASAWEAKTNEEDLKLGFLNDTHTTQDGSGEALALQTAQTLDTLGAEKLAAEGDNVYYNSATSKTDKAELQDKSIRVEFVADDAKLNYASDYASNKDIVFSDWSYGSTWIPGSLGKGQISDNRESYVFTATVNAPMEGTYTTKYAVSRCGSDLGGARYLSPVTISVGDTTIGNNIDNTVLQSLAIDGTYPTASTPLTLFQGSDVVLQEGENEITVTVDMPTDSGQPFVFSADYIQFTPKRLILKADSSDRTEFEDHILDFPYTLNDGSNYMPKISSGELASGGKFAEIDTFDGTADTDYEVRIPMTVEHAGMYQMEYVSLDNVSKMDIYIDSTDGEIINAGANVTIMDEKNADGIYPVFSSAWAQAKKFTKIVELPEGEHEVVLVIHPINSNADIALLLDYIQFTSLTKKISTTSRTLLEAEDYAGIFYLNNTEKTQILPEVKTSPNASGTSYIHYDTTRKEDHPAICADVCVIVEEDGTYDFEYVASDVGSKIHFYLDGLQINEAYTDTILDTQKNEEGKYDYFNEEHHAARKYTFSAELYEGEHTLSIEFQTRPEQDALDVAGCMDYVRITPPGLRKISTETATKIEFEDITTGTVVADNHASGGKVVFESWAAKKPSNTTTVLIDESGYYDISYIIGERTVNLTDGSSNGDAPYLSVVTISLDDIVIGTNDGEYTKILPEYSAWTEHASIMSLYEKESVWLDAGEYTLDADVAITPDSRYKYQLDCITFAPAGYVETLPEDSLVIENGVATATVSYDTYVAGTAVLAFYDAGQLVSMTPAPATGTKTVTVSAPVTGNSTNAKVFIWNSLAGGKPLAAEIELDFLN